MIEKKKKFKWWHILAAILIIGTINSFGDQGSTSQEDLPAVSAEETLSEDSGVEMSTINKLVSAAESVGIDKDQISHVEQIDDWSNGHRYQFSYSGLLLTAYEDDSGEIVTLKSGSLDFLRDGSAIKNVNDVIITSSQESRLIIASIDHVEKILKAPSTAEFPGSGILNSGEGWSLSRDGTAFAVQSYVDSQNSFGAMIRSHFELIYTWDGESDNATLSSFVFDGTKVI